MERREFNLSTLGIYIAIWSIITVTQGVITFNPLIQDDIAIFYGAVMHMASGLWIAWIAYYIYTSKLPSYHS